MKQLLLLFVSLILISIRLNAFEPIRISVTTTPIVSPTTAHLSVDVLSSTGALKLVILTDVDTSTDPTGTISLVLNNNTWSDYGTSPTYSPNDLLRITFNSVVLSIERMEVVITKQSLYGATISPDEIDQTDDFTFKQINILESGATPADKTIFQGGTQTGDITYTLPTGYATTNGQVLSSTTAGGLSWAPSGSGTVTGVTGTAPIASSGGATPVISISAATTSAAGSMSAEDKTKLDKYPTGTTTGQMLYWNGTAWVIVAAGSDGQVLEFRNGAPVWVDKDLNYLSVGDIYKGGIIAYFLQSGDPGYVANERHGLIAAPSDQSTYAEWGCSSISGAYGEAIGTGNQNTVAILADCSQGGIAAKLCFDLVLNGYSDWYLPSKDELNKLFLNKASVGGFANEYYWSSTQDPDNIHAWSQNFSNGDTFPPPKDQPHYVRAVRAF